MSSSDRGRRGESPIRRMARFWRCGGARPGACIVQPLYGPSNFADGGAGPVDPHPAFRVEPVDDRVGQQVRNRVIFQMTGGRRSPTRSTT